MAHEAWLNGWWRRGNFVLLGTAIHCAGCGKERGITTVAFPKDWEPPEKLPDWPFEQDTCPVCECLERQGGAPEDKLTARLVALQQEKLRLRWTRLGALVEFGEWGIRVDGLGEVERWVEDGAELERLLDSPSVAEEADMHVRAGFKA